MSHGFYKGYDFINREGSFTKNNVCAERMRVRFEQRMQFDKSTEFPDNSKCLILTLTWQVNIWQVVINFGRAYLIIWQVDIKIWQVDFIVWFEDVGNQKMAKLKKLKLILKWDNEPCKFNETTSYRGTIYTFTYLSLFSKTFYVSQHMISMTCLGYPAQARAMWYMNYNHGWYSAIQLESELLLNYECQVLCF